MLAQHASQQTTNALHQVARGVLAPSNAGPGQDACAAAAAARAATALREAMTSGAAADGAVPRGARVGVCAPGSQLPARDAAARERNRTARERYARRVGLRLAAAQRPDDVALGPGTSVVGGLLRCFSRHHGCFSGCRGSLSSSRFGTCCWLQ